MTDAVITQSAAQRGTTGSSPATGAPPRPVHRWTAGNVAAVVVLALVAAVWLLPFAWAVLTSVKPETDAASFPISIIPEHGFTLEAYTTILAEGQVPVWAWNSLFTAAVITFITVMSSALAAYAFSRIEFRGKRAVFVAAMLALAVPPQVLIVPLFYEMLVMNLVDTYWGLILPQV